MGGREELERGSGKGKEKAIAGSRAGVKKRLLEADVHPGARRGWTSITCGDLGICCTIIKEVAEKMEAVWGKDKSWVLTQCCKKEINHHFKTFEQTRRNTQKIFVIWTSLLGGGS